MPSLPADTARARKTWLLSGFPVLVVNMRGLTRVLMRMPELRWRVAGHDVSGAERHLPDLDVLDLTFQVSPGPVESAEVQVGLNPAIPRPFILLAAGRGQW
jgi:hypothetical protein